MTTVTRNTPLIQLETKQYPTYMSDIKALFPNTIFPAEMTDESVLEFGFAVVVPTPRPDAPITTEAQPTLIDGVWTQTWTSRDYSEQEKDTQFQSLKLSKSLEVEAFRVSQFEKGFPYTFAEGEYHVQIRTADRQNISSIRVIAKEAIAAGKALPIKFRVYENVTVALTAEEFVTLADTAFSRSNEGYQASWDLKDLIALAETANDFPELPVSLFAPVADFAKA